MWKPGWWTGLLDVAAVRWARKFAITTSPAQGGITAHGKLPEDLAEEHQRPRRRSGARRPRPSPGTASLPSSWTTRRAPFYRWFPDGELNTCFNALDRHVEQGRGEQPALIYDSPVTGVQATFTYASCAMRWRGSPARWRALASPKATGSSSTCRWCPRRLIAMLACARLGAVHSVVFGGFAPHELAIRIEDARPRVVVSASCGIEGSRVIEYKPMLDARSRSRATSPTAA